MMPSDHGRVVSLVRTPILLQIESIASTSSLFLYRGRVSVRLRTTQSQNRAPGSYTEVRRKDLQPVDALQVARGQAGAVRSFHRVGTRRARQPSTCGRCPHRTRRPWFSFPARRPADLEKADPYPRDPNFLPRARMRDLAGRRQASYRFPLQRPPKYDPHFLRRDFVPAVVRFRTHPSRSRTEMRMRRQVRIPAIATSV
jgi:hypothetical protein